MKIRTWTVTDKDVIGSLIFLRSEAGYDFFDLPADHPDYDPATIYARDMDGVYFAVEDPEAEGLDEHIGHYLTWARARKADTIEIPGGHVFDLGYDGDFRAFTVQIAGPDRLVFTGEYIPRGKEPTPATLDVLIEGKIPEDASLRTLLSLPWDEYHVEVCS